MPPLSLPLASSKWWPSSWLSGSAHGSQGPAHLLGRHGLQRGTSEPDTVVWERQNPAPQTWEVVRQCPLHFSCPFLGSPCHRRIPAAGRAWWPTAEPGLPCGLSSCTLSPGLILWWMAKCFDTPPPTRLYLLIFLILPNSATPWWLSVQVCEPIGPFSFNLYRRKIFNDESSYALSHWLSGLGSSYVN